MNTYPVADGYALRGIDPPGMERFPDDVRRLYWQWVLEIGIRQKDRDLSKGLDKDGKPMRAISAQTRKYRKSAMTPSGKGDPNAPPLIPGWQKSRVRSLLTGRAYVDHCEWFWRFDPLSGDSFARVLEFQAKQGRDVFGLSPAALMRVRAQAWERFEKWRKGFYVEKTASVRPAPPITVGRTDKRFTEPMGSGPPEKHAAMTYEKLVEHLRQSAKAVLPGRPLNPKSQSPFSGPGYNRLLQIIYGMPGPKPPRGGAPTIRMPSPITPKPLVRRQLVPEGVFARLVAWLKGAA